MTPRVPKYAKPDGNQEGIVNELRARGYDVDIMPSPNKYDIVVSGQKVIILHQFKHCVLTDCSVRVEVKQPGETLRDNQLEWLENQMWPGAYIQAETYQQIMAWFGDWSFEEEDETT